MGEKSHTVFNREKYRKNIFSARSRRVCTRTRQPGTAMTTIVARAGALDAEKMPESELAALRARLDSSFDSNALC
jgi:hypothetical protein